MLDDVKGNWERRLSCLRRLQSLALGSLASSSITAQLVKSVKAGLVKGISDLRSAIVREAAGAIACLAEVLPTPIFDTLVDVLAPDIIKGLPIAVRVIADSADFAARAIISRTTSVRFMQHVLQSIHSTRAPVACCKCAECTPPAPIPHAQVSRDCRTAGTSACVSSTGAPTRQTVWVTLSTVQ